MQRRSELTKGSETHVAVAPPSAAKEEDHTSNSSSASSAAAMTDVSLSLPSPSLPPVAIDPTMKMMSDFRAVFGEGVSYSGIVEAPPSDRPSCISPGNWIGMCISSTTLSAGSTTACRKKVNCSGVIKPVELSTATKRSPPISSCQCDMFRRPKSGESVFSRHSVRSRSLPWATPSKPVGQCCQSSAQGAGEPLRTKDLQCRARRQVNRTVSAYEKEGDAAPSKSVSCPLHARGHARVLKNIAHVPLR